MAEDLELHRAYCGEHGGLVAASIRTQDLRDAFLLQLLDAAPELLVFTGVGSPGDSEILGGEARYRREDHRYVAEQRVARAQ